MRPVCASSFSAGWRDLSTRLFHNNLPSPYTHGRPCGRGQVEFSWCIYVTSKKAGRQAPGLWELQSGVIFFRQRGRLPPRLEPLKRPSYSEDWNKKRHARSGGSSFSCLAAQRSCVFFMAFLLPRFSDHRAKGGAGSGRPLPFSSGHNRFARNRRDPWSFARVFARVLICAPATALDRWRWSAYSKYQINARRESR